MKTQKDLKILAGVVLMLLLIGTVADLTLSHHLYNPNSLFGKVFEVIGEFPSSFIASFCAMIIARSRKKIGFKQIGSFVLSILLSVMAGFLLIAYWNGPGALGIVFAIGVFLADFLGVGAICKNENADACKAAKIGLQLFLVVIVFFNLAKLGWGRERYRHMVATGDFSGFSHWFLPQGLASGNEFMSFPSGHSANAAIVMWITLFPKFIPALEKKENILKVIACIWIGCVMVSRIIMGAHFLSDVTMGMTISLVLFYVFYQKQYAKSYLEK